MLDLFGSEENECFDEDWALELREAALVNARHLGAVDIFEAVCEKVTTFDLHSLFAENPLQITLVFAWIEFTMPPAAQDDGNLSLDSFENYMKSCVGKSALYQRTLSALRNLERSHAQQVVESLKVVSSSSRICAVLRGAVLGDRSRPGLRLEEAQVIYCLHQFALSSEVDARATFLGFEAAVFAGRSKAEKRTRASHIIHDPTVVDSIVEFDASTLQRVFAEVKGVHQRVQHSTRPATIGTLSQSSGIRM